MGEPSDLRATILCDDEPAPVIVVPPSSDAPFVLTCEHASNLVPRKLDSLGLSAAQLSSHIALDNGAYAVAQSLAAQTGGCLVAQAYSRLVIDCNRLPHSDQLIPRMADGVMVPGNSGEQQRSERLREIYHPFHDEVARQLALQKSRGANPPAIVAIHSFTPELSGVMRPWHIGVCYDPEDRLGSMLVVRLRRQRADLCIGDNEPYDYDPSDDATLSLHSSLGIRPGVLIEIRANEIDTAQKQRVVAQLLASALSDVLSSY
ncbi:MAG: N-formylglutamate amidohydrolase [Pseudomonadota bacterium]